MYDFRDVNEFLEDNTLPSEALKLNGEYIENQIEGYRTLNVSGREILSKEIETHETGISNGSTSKYVRYPRRIITVKYQLIAKTNSEFRSAYNKLNLILNVENAEIIFKDEDDKFFIGTPYLIGDIEPGLNSVIGEIEILCNDPFKYSVEEYEVSPNVTSDRNAFVIDYNGTYKSYPTLEAAFYSEEDVSEDGESEQVLTGNGDCGYVAFFNENEKIIQLGDPEESDDATYPKSQTLINQSFKTKNSWNTAAKALWKVNNGTTSSSSVAQTGTIAIVKPAEAVDPNMYYVKANTYGSGTNYHGPSITRIFPLDKAGDKGAKNFTFTYRQKMSIGKEKNDVKQRGVFQCLLVNDAKKIIAGVSIFKGSDGKKGKLRFYVNGKTKQTINIDLSYHNKYIGNDTYKTVKGKYVRTKKTVKTSIITKVGSKITFNIGGIKKVFTDSSVKDSIVTGVTFTFGKYASKTPLTYNGLYNAKFVKNNCDTWRDIPNKFGTDDIVVADCKTGEILLNDSPTPEYGALGNDWEDFYLTPGINQIGASYSDWVEDSYAPGFKIRYREVFL